MKKSPELFGSLLNHSSLKTQPPLQHVILNNKKLPFNKYHKKFYFSFCYLLLPYPIAATL